MNKSLSIPPDSQPALLPNMPPVATLDETHAAAQLVFEQALADLPWGAAYAAMIAKGFRWREAAFVAWSVIPKSQRRPRLKGELADLLGCSPQKIVQMEADPRLNAMRLAMARIAYIDALPDIIAASVEVASDPSYKATPERNHILGKVLGLAEENINVNMGQKAFDYSRMSDEELAALAAGEDDGDG